MRKNIKAIAQNGAEMIYSGIMEMACQSGGDNVRGLELRLPILSIPPPKITFSFHCRQNPNIKFVVSGEPNFQLEEGFTQVTIFAQSWDGRPYDPLRFIIDCHFIIVGSAKFPEM